MDNGSIEVLGKREIMLPAPIMIELQKLDTRKFYDVVKQGVRDAMEEDARRIGMEGEGTLKISQEIFCTFGLGKPEIIVLDNKAKRGVVHVRAPVADKSLVAAALAGMFSVLFKKDIDCKVTHESALLIEFALS
jgi:predicted hydrocarbon binding protein